MLEDLPDRRESFIRWFWEVTRGLSGVFLVTPSVLVSIAVSGISEGDLKCRGSHYHMGPRNPTPRISSLFLTWCHRVIGTMDGGGTSDLMGPPTELPWLAFTPLHLNL